MAIAVDWDVMICFAETFPDGRQAILFIIDRVFKIAINGIE